MDATVMAGLVGAGAALIGAGIGAGTSVLIERRRARESALEAHRATLRTACSDFTAAIARVRSDSYALPAAPGPVVVVSPGLDEARAGCERLRILVSDMETQRAARMALRHAYSVWKAAETGTDPRAAEYPDKKPRERLREELTRLYIGVRRELGVSHPEDVFEDLEN